MNDLEYIKFCDFVHIIMSYNLNWKTKHGMIFNDEIAMEIVKYPNFHYRESDLGYESDAISFYNSVKDAEYIAKENVGIISL